MSQPTLLLVEDDPVVRKVFRATLGRAGYEVLEAIDGRTAFDLIAEERIDLVLQDLRLPDMQGIDLAERIRELHGPDELPIVAVSGVSATLEHAQLLESLFNDFLLKPVEPARLLDVVRSYVPLVGDSERLPGGHRLALIADDDGLQRKVTAIRFRRQGFRVREAGDGEEAVELALAEPPAIIVSNADLRGLDGFRLCQTVQETPLLAHIPVVLVSPRKVTREDAAMARTCGARAYVKRSSACDELLAAALDILGSGEAARDRTPAGETGTTGDIVAMEAPTVGRTEPHDDPDSTSYRARLIRQLERQAQITTELTRANNLQAAQLSVLAGVSETLTRTLDLEAAVGEALARCTDVSVFSLGAAFLMKEGRLSLVASHGFPDSVRGALGDAFGHLALLEQALTEDEILTIPSRRSGLGAGERLLEATGSKSIQLVPLCTGKQKLGVLMLASLGPDLRRRGFAFARTIQGQLAQAIHLGRSLDQLAASEQRFRRVAEAIAEGLLISEGDGQITFMNAAARRLFGISSSGPPGMRLQELLPGIQGSAPSWEGLALALNGAQPTVRVSTSLTGSGAGLERTHLVQDVTEARAQEAELRTLAEHDALTGLLNRRSFLDRVHAELAEGQRGAILFIDLDGFKAINDVHGHGAGDLVLERLSDALTERLRKSDVIGRIGGDEFAVLQPGAEDRDALSLGNQVLRTVRGLMTHIDGAPVDLGASIGAVLFPRDGATPEQLIERADAGMYEAKRNGGNQVVIWAP